MNGPVTVTTWPDMLQQLRFQNVCQSLIKSNHLGMPIVFYSGPARRLHEVSKTLSRCLKIGDLVLWKKPKWMDPKQIFWMEGKIHRWELEFFYFFAAYINKNFGKCSNFEFWNVWSKKEIPKFDLESGQVQIVYNSQNVKKYWWTHADFKNEIQIIPLEKTGRIWPISILLFNDLLSVEQRRVEAINVVTEQIFDLEIPSSIWDWFKTLWK